MPSCPFKTIAGLLSRIAPALAFLPLVISAQPAPAPSSGDAVCEAPPAQAIEPDRSVPDSEGFYPLFNGIDFSGWWLDCLTAHTAMQPDGPIVRADSGRKALYTTQRGLSTGGVLMTRARFTDYEIVFDYWPDWGNMAALLNRSDAMGRAYATTLGYGVSTSLGGVWGEAGFPSRDFRPFFLGTEETSIITPGNTPEVRSWWTKLTSQLKAKGETFPCPDSGCTQADWRQLWDFDGWNQIRILFHGGRHAGDPVHARTWFRKMGAAEWVPLEVDTTLAQEIPPGYIGLRIHGGGGYAAPRGTWYRNIRWKPWSPSSTGIPPERAPGSRPSIVIHADPDRRGIRIVFAEGERPRNLRIYSLDGRPIAELRGAHGDAYFDLTGHPRGLYLLRAETAGRREEFRFLFP